MLEGDSFLRSGLRRLFAPGAVAHGHPRTDPLAPSWASPDQIEVIDLTGEEEDVMYDTGTGTDAESFVPPSSPLLTVATDESLEVSNVKMEKQFNNQISQDALLLWLTDFYLLYVSS